METIAISKVRPNSENPRYIKEEKFKKLVQSLREFPEMANVRPIVVNKEMVVLGGNMRLKAMQEAGWKEVPVEVVDWSEEKQREFIIKDNVGFGEWDWDELANTWNSVELNEWGMDVPFTDDDIEEMKNPTNQSSENPFAIELDRESNYIVLKFDTDIDWIQAKTLFNLSSVASRRANGKPWSIGIGRVIDGALAIKNIQNES